MPSSSSSLGLWLLVWMLVIMELRGDEDLVSDVGGVSLDQVDAILSQVVEHHLVGCHLVLATSTTDKTTIFPSILRRLAAEGQASVVVELASLSSQDQPTQDHLLQGLWGDTRTNCRAFILLVDESSTNLPFRFLESSRLWLEPEAPVVVIGGPAAVAAVTHHTSLRNTIHMLGLTLHSFKRMTSPVDTWLRRGTMKKAESEEVVKAFRRCLYCSDGEPGIQQLPEQSSPSSPVQWDDTVFPEKLQNFKGHTFQVVTGIYFPFIDYEKSKADGDSLLTPRDCLDVRILNAISTRLNFTYEMREPWYGKWGVPMTGGNWSGIVGTLQHHKADFSLNLTPSPARMEVITHTRIYTYDPLLIVSPKPEALPRHSALLRPFTGDLWVMIIVFTSAAGVILWLLQKTWSCVSGHPSIRLVPAISYTWGVLLQEPLTCSSVSIGDQVFVGWWLLSCLLIDASYRSSLIAHLSAQSKFLPINSFEDILKREGWSWGVIPLRGTTFLYFNQTSDPVIQKIYKNALIYDQLPGIERVMAGGFSFINYKSQIDTEIAPFYQDRYGNMPFHVSTTKYTILGGNSWGVRQGAPFLGRLRQMKQRLIEAGLVDLWLHDVIKIRVRKFRANRSEALQTMYTEVEDGQVVLRLDHLQGAFYLLLLGLTLASMTLLGETLALRHTLDHQSHIPG